MREGICPPVRSIGATRILTAEISGIAPALMTAMHMKLPVVYARKTKPITMPDTVYLTVAPSHTKGRMVELIVSPEYLARGERVLIIDDFLASGATILGLVRLAQAAGSEVVGIGTLIEKSFEGGRDALAHLNVPIESLACITRMEEWRDLVSAKPSQDAVHLTTCKQEDDARCHRHPRFWLAVHPADCPARARAAGLFRDLSLGCTR